MQEQHLFEYAVIRVMPRVEREEFFNVGVVLYCAGQRFLRSTFVIDEQRLRAFGCETDISQLESYLGAIARICTGDKEAGPIAKLPIAERFRWLTATRSTVVQTSKVHTGFCPDAEEMLERLFLQMVL